MPISTSELFQGIDSVTARARTRNSIGRVQRETGGMAQFVAPLILNRDPRTQGVSNIDLALDRYTVPFVSSPQLEFRPVPYTSNGVSNCLDLHQVHVPDHLGQRLHTVIIGTGAAGILSGRVLAELGLGNVTYLSPDMTPGGLWVDEDKWGQVKPYGYNNPSEVQFLNAHLPILPLRQTDVVQTFLHDAADPRILANTVKGIATGINYNTHDRTHTVHYSNRLGHERELPPADIVYVATGNRPLPLNDGYISLSNTENVPVKRWPELLTSEEARELNANGKRILCLAWGNSSMARARELNRINNTYGYDIDVVFLTHLPRETLDNPYMPYRQGDGQFRSVARDLLRGELTRLELDLAQSADIFRDCKDEIQDASGNIVFGTITDVIACRFVTEKDGTVNAKVTQRDKTTGIETELTVPNIGELDAFVGFGNDPSLMRDFGLDVIDEHRGTVKQRTFDGRADTNDERTVLLMGAAGATRDDSSARVLTGAIRRAKEGALTAICSAAELTALAA